MRYSPRDYQVRSLSWIESRRGSCLFQKMGAGKTVVALTALSNFLDSARIKGTLVVAPMRVVYNVWRQEADKWDHLRHLRFSIVHGDSAAEREAGLVQDADIYLINYEGIIWLTKRLARMKRWPFDAIIWDEISQMKSWRTRRFKLFKKHVPRFCWRLGLTGTPTPQTLLNLFSEIFLIDGGERLGTTVGNFKTGQFKQVDRDGHIWVPKAGTSHRINRKLADICLTVEDYAGLPDLVENDVLVTLPSQVRKQYRGMEKEFILELKNHTIDAVNSAVKTGKLLQIAQGAVYVERGSTEYEELHQEKLDALEEILDQQGGEPAIVVYNLRSDLDRIQRRFPGFEVMDRTGEDIVRRWNRREIPVLLTQATSSRYGLNMQDGGSTMIWFGLTWSTESYLQMVARLHRQGQKKTVFCHRILASETVDMAVRESLRRKARTQEEFLQAFQAIRG